MRPHAANIRVIVMVTLLAITLTMMISVKMLERNSDSVIPEIGQEIPLTNAEIATRWPNLPTAKQIYEKDICLVMDTSHLADGFSESRIVNCTTTAYFYNLGATFEGENSITKNKQSYNVITTPNIWLQYNNTAWVKVPLTYFNYEVYDSWAIYS